MAIPFPPSIPPPISTPSSHLPQLLQLRHHVGALEQLQALDSHQFTSHLVQARIHLRVAVMQKHIICSGIRPGTAHISSPVTWFRPVCVLAIKQRVADVQHSVRSVAANISLPVTWFRPPYTCAVMQQHQVRSAAAASRQIVGQHLHTAPSSRQRRLLRSAPRASPQSSPTPDKHQPHSNNPAHSPHTLPKAPAPISSPRVHAIEPVCTSALCPKSSIARACSASVDVATSSGLAPAPAPARAPAPNAAGAGPSSKPVPGLEALPPPPPPPCTADARASAAWLILKASRGCGPKP